MKNLIHSAIKKVTLELIYEAVDDRTKEVKEEVRLLTGKVEHLEGEMNRRFEHLNTRIDQLFSLIVNQRKDS